MICPYCNKRIIEIKRKSNKTLICNNKKCLMFVDINKVKKWEREEIDIIKDLRHQGYSYRDIEKEIGIPKSTLFRRVSQNKKRKSF